MTGWLATLESRGGLVARFAALCGILCLIAMALMTIADVMMRWLFNDPIDGVADIGPLVIAIAVAATFPFAVTGRHHVTIGFLGALLGARGRLLLNRFATFVTTLFFALFAWQFLLYALKLEDRGQTTWILRMPVAPWWAVVAFFLIICAVLQVVVFLSEWRDGEKPAADAAARPRADREREV